MFVYLVFLLCFSLVNCYVTVWDGVDGSTENTCSSFTGLSMTRGTVTPNQINGVFVSYMLDHDGSLNTKTSGTNRNFVGWNSNYDSSSLFRGDISATNEITLNMGLPVLSLTQCQANCNQFESCIGVIYGTGLAADHGANQIACQFMTQCKRATAGTAMRASYMRTTWDGFVPSSITPFSICDGSPAVIFNIVSTVKECFLQCDQNGNTISHFELDPDLGCRCFSSCANPTQAIDDNNNHDEISWRTTIYGMPSAVAPTNSPTHFPTDAPTLNPTDAPSKGPITEPITPPTVSPTVSQTQAPSLAPTTKNTDESSSGASGVEVFGYIVLTLALVVLGRQAYILGKAYMEKADMEKNKSTKPIASYMNF